MIIFCFAIGAAFVQRTTGFGFGIFIMTMLPYLLPSFGEATALSGLLASVTSLIITLRYHTFIPWRKLLPILTTFLIVSYFAIQLLTTLHSETLRIILGIALISAAIYFWFFASEISVKPNFPTQASLGTLSGFMGGLFGMQGPPAVLYFLQVTRSKEEYTAMAQSYFLFGNIMMTIYRAQAGYITPTVLTDWLIGIPGVLLGTYLGGKVFNRMSMPLLRKVVYIYIAISGIIALL